jgi:OOP family OmpA-OmpF porin
MGILMVLLLLFFSLPFATQYISKSIEDRVQVDLAEKGLTWAKVKVDGRDIKLSGYTLDPEEHQQALVMVRANPWVRNIDNNITPPQVVKPYTLTIDWDGERLTLEGYVASDKDKATIDEEIITTFAGKTVQNNLTVAIGAPQDWATLTSELLKKIAIFEFASIQMVDETIYISGKTQTSKDVNVLEDSIRPFSRKATPAGYVFKTQVVALDDRIFVCQELLSSLMKDNKIYFKSGTKNIDSRSDVLLNELADSIIFCATSTIIITGHTDNVGSEEENFRLSEQRAKAVKARLFTRGGVPLQRLKVMGQGASSPIATNETEDGRAKNRRIEFTVEGI